MCQVRGQPPGYCPCRAGARCAGAGTRACHGRGCAADVTFWRRTARRRCGGQARPGAVWPSGYGRPCPSGEVSLRVIRVKDRSPGWFVTGRGRQKVTSAG